jgi:hypothetical protein
MLNSPKNLDVCSLLHTSHAGSRGAATHAATEYKLFSAIMPNFTLSLDHVNAPRWLKIQ